MTDTASTENVDANGLIKPNRPRRMHNDLLPRAGSNHMGSLRRELVNVFNSTVVSGRHVDEFFALMLTVTKETKAFMAEQKQYEIDKRTLAEQLRVHKDERKAVLEEAKQLASDTSPLVTVFQFTDTKKLDKWAAEEYNIRLDGRKELEFMQTDFVRKYKRKETKGTK
jgi:hypothetical protein